LDITWQYKGWHLTKNMGTQSLKGKKKKRERGPVQFSNDYKCCEEKGTFADRKSSILHGGVRIDPIGTSGRSKGLPILGISEEKNLVIGT